MRNKLAEIIRRYESILVYLVFGVLTTLVSYLVYFPLLNVFHLPAAGANMISWAAAVTFAFLTNKPFVFKSNDWSLQAVIPELTKFVGTRVASGLLETGILLITVDILHWNGNIWKIITSVLVVVLNYIGSKFLVFRRNS